MSNSYKVSHCEAKDPTLYQLHTWPSHGARVKCRKKIYNEKTKIKTISPKRPQQSHEQSAQSSRDKQLKDGICLFRLITVSLAVQLTLGWLGEIRKGKWKSLSCQQTDKYSVSISVLNPGLDAFPEDYWYKLHNIGWGKNPNPQIKHTQGPGIL